MSFKQFLTENIARTNALKKQQELIDAGVNVLKITKLGDVYELKVKRGYWYCTPTGNVVEYGLSAQQFPNTAYEFAVMELKKPWPYGEAAIATDSHYSFYYAMQILKGRFLAGEAAIVKTEFASDYAIHILKARWPEAEPTIKLYPEEAVAYAKHVIGSRWEEAESSIMRHGTASYLYARDVIKGPWPEAEPIIANNPAAALDYARDVLKGPFPAAEERLERTIWWSEYEKIKNQAAS